MTIRARSPERKGSRGASGTNASVDAVRYGTRYELQGGLIVRIVDRDGHEHAAAQWEGDRLVRLSVAGGAAVVDGAVAADALLGRAQRVTTAHGATTVSAIDWARPTEIPAIAAPAVLGGAGPSLLNVLAVLAQHAGVEALRYAGPYPTPALFRSLARSFRTTATEDAFSADVVARSATLARDAIPIDFAPAPAEHVAMHGIGHVELRDGLERAVIGGVAYDGQRAPGHARLVPDGERGHHAEIWIGDAPYARIATFDRAGRLLASPHEPPACTSAVVGKAFPPALVAAIAELVADTVPAPLAAAARAYLAGRPLVWADLGVALARATPEATLVHAALWDRLAPRGLARVALAIAEALAPVVTRAVAATLAT